MRTQSTAFRPDQAIYYLPYTELNAPATIRPGVVLSVTEKRVRIRIEDQRPVHVLPNYICYRGYCERCQLPAVEDAGRLICPQCDGPAVDAIPPDRILFEQFGDLPAHARAARDILAGKGITYQDCSPRNRDSAAWHTMLDRTNFGYGWSKHRERFSWREKERLEALAVLGDEAAFVAEYRQLVAAHDLKDPIKEYEEHQLTDRLYRRIVHLVESGAFDGLDIDILEPADLLSLPQRPSRTVCIDIAA